MIVFFPATMGSGSTFTLNLLRDLLKPQWYYHLDTEDVVLQLMHKPGHHLIHTSIWDGDHSFGLHVPYEKAEEWMQKADKVVVSIRDPMKVLTTQATMQRRPDATVANFLAYVDWAKKYDMFFIPIDLDKDFAIKGLRVVKKRLNLLSSLMHFLQLPEVPEIQERWAREWPVYNNSSQYREKKEPVSDRVDLLMEHRQIIRPFLEDIGYRGLSWWG